jgi:hypothetical protein
MKAFPTDRLGVIQDTRGISINQAQQDGMDLRDYFAAKAMHAMIASGRLPTGIMMDTAEEAYLMADIMMKARKQ